MSDADLFEASVIQANAGRLDEALVLARRATVADPASVRAHAQVGALLAALGRPDEAIAALQGALTLDPARPDVLNNLGSVWRMQGHTERARAAFARAIELDPDYADAAFNLAGALQNLDRDGEAIVLLQKLAGVGGSRSIRAAAIRERVGNACGSLGNALIEDGRIAAASAAFQAAIAALPERAEFYSSLFEADPSAITGEHIEALEAMANTQAGRAQAEAHFALGKSYAFRGDRRRSFAHFVEANARVRATLEYDEDAALGAVEDIAETFDARYLRKHAESGYPSPVPVFIVGMPRSGSTLVEQILASHPSVYGAGELTVFSEVAAEMLGGRPAPLRAVGAQYVRAVARRFPQSADALRVTDKMLDNFRYAGLIHLALPDARIIHVRRNPIDTCLSCFSHSFAAADRLPWTYDLAELGRFYRKYLDLMEHWRRVLPPSAMLEVNYEDVVDDLEAQARRLIAYCDLPWDDRCLEFYNTRRPIKTASVAQVRRPIYRTSMNAAQGYGDALQPLIDALGAQGIPS